MKCNLLHINMSKCSFIHFQPKFDSDETCARVRPYASENDKSKSIFINGVKISKVSSTKFLGVIIDEKLNWGPHLQYLRKKLRSITGALCRIRKSVPVDLYLKIYNALFESHLSYGISVWGASIKDKCIVMTNFSSGTLMHILKNSQLVHVLGLSNNRNLE